MPSNHLFVCHPLLLLPSVFPSIKVFSDESVLCIRWSEYWSFSFSISPSSEYLGLISFRMDWLDLLAAQSVSTKWFIPFSPKASLEDVSQRVSIRSLLTPEGWAADNGGRGGANKTGELWKKVTKGEKINYFELLFMFGLDSFFHCLCVSIIPFPSTIL